MTVYAIASATLKRLTSTSVGWNLPSGSHHVGLRLDGDTDDEITLGSLFGRGAVGLGAAGALTIVYDDATLGPILLLRDAAHRLGVRVVGDSGDRAALGSISGSGSLVLGNGAGVYDVTLTRTGAATALATGVWTLTSPVVNTGVSGTAIDTDSTMAANSDTKLASQKATKAAIAAERTATRTLTNARVTQRVLALSANSATPAINTDSYDVVNITAQTAAITSFTTNLTGTPVDGDRLRVSITGTAAVALTWGASFEASTVALPTTTVTTARLDVGFFWNSATTKWRCVASC